ncbi:MAG TPA: recombinase family protein [Frateuria sp.]|uniref:recombinase family protein n=1 Tax=Frateuria sp. TaxID=2211372 RepID=UPI002D80B626|nr:recombinase family protein [Frateuria sp.]HET6805345.1 recombinase family protein [Frateuria sp.]
MNLLGYVRVSTEEQAREGLSLGQQIERLRAYCELHGHTLIDVHFDGGVSASVPLAKRPAGKQLLARLKAGEGRGVVVLRLDRLFRDALDGLAFFRGTAERLGVAVHSVTELIDSSTPAGRLSLTIQLAAAQYERDLAVQRATECNASLREQGKVYGHVPYGCVAVGAGGDRRLLRDPETWCHREAAVRLLKTRSLRGAASELAERGIPSPTGKPRWSPNTLRALRTHHDSLRKLPMAQPATGDTATPDPEVSPHA